MPILRTTSQIKVDGDLELDTAGSFVDKDEHGRSYLQIPVNNASTRPSTITFSEQKVTVDRTVAEGELRVEVSGSFIQTAGVASSSFPQSDTIGSVAVANVVVPTNGTIMNSAIFTVGSTAYTVNDVEKKLDVAPFIDKNGRTLMPVRAVAEAFGARINWDDQTKTIYLN